MELWSNWIKAPPCHGGRYEFDSRQFRMNYEEEQREYWEERYGCDKDPLVTWEEFKENYLYCERCKGWVEGQCICYAR